MALTLTLSGCSDDDGDGESKQGGTPTNETTAATGKEPSAAAESQSPEKALEAAYRRYIKAFLTGDGATVYELLSQRCRDATPLSEVAELSETAADLYGLVDYEIKSVKVSGKRGTLDAEYPVEALNQGGGTEWILEGGKWRSDKCG